jgi:hypothetical protein
VGEPFGFTVAFGVALELVTPVVGWVVTVGAEPEADVVNESTVPYVFVAAEFVATAWK